MANINTVLLYWYYRLCWNGRKPHSTFLVADFLSHFQNKKKTQNSMEQRLNDDAQTKLSLKILYGIRTITFSPYLFHSFIVSRLEYNTKKCILYVLYIIILYNTRSIICFFFLDEKSIVCDDAFKLNIKFTWNFSKTAYTFTRLYL